MTDLQAALIQQFTATHDGDPWFGSSRSSLLAGLTPEQAAAHPIPGGHSIWQLVLHMTAWTNEVGRRLEGHPAAEPREGDWPPVPTISSEAWDAAQADLGAAHARVLATIAVLPPIRWAEPVGRSRQPELGTGVTVTGMLVGLAQHDAYHCGQVALLRRAAGRP
jgi:uncharacterized damage-inducible protein DinB